MRLIAAQFLCLLTLIVPNFSYGQNAPVVVELFSSQAALPAHRRMNIW
jgi:hypothetical protein